jgi:putative ABC transport system substrate-binding protein
MKRREFITLAGGATIAWRLNALAQQSARLPTIGYLGATTASAEKSRTDAFVGRLRELGWIESRTIAIEYDWGEGRRERMATIAAKFIRLKVDARGGNSPGLSVQAGHGSHTDRFWAGGDPLGTGLVASLARPGGNITGLSNQAADLASKRLDVLRELLPSFSRLATLSYADYPGRKEETDEVQQAARTLGLEVATFEIRRAEDIATVMDRLKGRFDALYVVGDPFLNSNRVRISTLAVGVRLPTIYVHRGYVEAGGLMSYGTNIPDLFRRAADYVDKILHGANPADLPVEQPTQV